MFGLSALFNALARLTASINTSAALFDAANAHLARQLSIDGPADAPALEHKPADDDGQVEAEAPAKPARNGRKAKADASA